MSKRTGIAIIYVVLIALVALPVLSAAGTTETCQGLVVWPHEKSDLVSDPALVFGRLPNGFRYVLMANKEPRERVSIHLNVQVGSAQENEDERGLAHFLEHMLFNGSTHFKPGELVKYFQRIGMQFGPDANAHTGFNETVYDILLPNGEKKELEEALLVMQDYAKGALLLQEEIDRERNVVLAEKRTRDSASYRTFEKTMAFELQGSILPDRLPIGVVPVIKEAGQKRFKTFYDTWYRPEAMVIIMVGDFDLNIAQDIITEKFKDLTARAEACSIPQIGRVAHTGVKSFYHHESELGVTTVSIERVETVMREPDSFAFQKRMLFKQLAEQIVQSRLDRMISQSEAPFTSASINSGIYLQEVFYADISAECPPDKWAQTLGRIEQVLRQAEIYGFTETELARVKKDYLAEMERAVKAAATRTSQSMARRIIWHLNEDRVLQSPAQELALFGPVIERATRDEILRAFQDNWKGEDRLVLVTGDAEIKGGPEKKILGVYDASREQVVVQPENRTMAVFPYLTLPESTGGNVVQTEVVDLDITVLDFPNGIRVYLKPTDFKDNEVLFSASFGYGTSEEPLSHRGLGMLSAVVLEESGTGKLTTEDLAEALAGKNTTMGFQVGEDTFQVRGSSVSDELEVMFQLLYTQFTDPGYREDAFERVMEQFRQRYEALMQNADGVFELTGRHFLSGGDSRFGMPPLEVFKRNRLEDVRKWMTLILASGKLELSIVGDFDKKTAVMLARRYMGALPSRGERKASRDARHPVFPAGQSLSPVVPTAIPKGLVDVAYGTDDVWNIDQSRRLTVLGEVVSERMRIRIREKLGAAYSPYAFNAPSRAYPGYGVFHAVVQVAPEQASAVRSEIKSLVEDLAAAGITDDEFKRALDPLLTGLRDMRRTNRYWLYSVLSGSWRHPQQFDWARTILDSYGAIRKNEILDLAKKYLVNDRAAEVTILPAKKE